MKECTACKQILPFTEFWKRTYKSGTVGYQNKCKTCSSKKRATYYKPHQYMRTKFKLSEEQYDALMTNTHCQICQVPLTKKCIDHCHTTGKIRGVLCNNCNCALGLVKDNTDTLKTMINYLENHN